MFLEFFIEIDDLKIFSTQNFLLARRNGVTFSNPEDHFDEEPSYDYDFYVEVLTWEAALREKGLGNFIPAIRTILNQLVEREKSIREQHSRLEESAR